MHRSIASVVITIYLDSLYLIQFESETEVFKQLCGKLIKTSVLRKDHKFCHVKHYILLSVILWYLIFNPGKTATKSTQKTFFGPRRRGGGGLCLCDAGLCDAAWFPLVSAPQWSLAVIQLAGRCRAAPLAQLSRLRGPPAQSTLGGSSHVTLMMTWLWS